MKPFAWNNQGIEREPPFIGLFFDVAEIVIPPTVRVPEEEVEATVKEKYLPDDICNGPPKINYDSSTCVSTNRVS